jgi:hypothetical protein
MEWLKLLADFLKSCGPFLLKWFGYVHFTHPGNGDTVNRSHFDVTGKFRFLAGLKLALFRVEGNQYWPQGSAIIDPTHKNWKKDVWAGAEKGKQYTFIVAAVSDDVRLTLNYYSQVNGYLKRNHGIDIWVPFSINSHEMPPGLTELDRITVTLV